MLARRAFATLTRAVYRPIVSFKLADIGEGITEAEVRFCGTKTRGRRANAAETRC